ncbi:cullin-associated NEDD8-dissociated protein 1 isoform X3 [Sagmatias obliquidens]|uniref:cullin-associated NEDD8-dissociated protein 1 isoform X3 n=1 Tax=Sagmatias obliquidens TaxID=3371155 RepID=UPI000F445DDD|nr:cullin-associated NEDD8-dissociated protein 1 isoform X3 [Lagenorhynchus obliquidens]
MASASYHISNLLEKMTSSDKDFRFMATNDLMTELQKDSIKLDDDSERKVVKMILKLLEDKNGEVQNLAVKCLGPLVSKVKEYQVETIVDTLCTNMLSDKEQLRDISSIGLKTVIGELPPASSGSALAANVCKKITGRLTSAIAKQEDVSVQLEALDIMADMLSRQGGLLVNFHPSILTCLLPQLTSPRLAVRKRTIIALGHLVMSCGNIVFVDLIEHLLSELSKNDSMSTTRTYIQCIAAISRQAGHRIGEYLEKIIPLVVKFCNVDDDELREYCIQAFESFVRRCPKEVYPHVSTIINICLKYLTYDPNYNYDDEDEDENAMDADGGDDDDQGSDDEYSDDDDMSWKVRRAAAKCLDAVVSTRHEMLPEFYKTVSPALISRFKEREENVKADVFHAYLSLLKQTRPVQSWLCDPDAMEQGETPLTMLQSQVPNIVKALHKQMKEKSVKTRQCCFNMLTELVNVLPGALTQHIPVLVPGSSYARSSVVTAVKFTISDHPQPIDPLLKNCIGDFLKTLEDPDLNVRRVALVTFNSAAHNKPSLIRDLLDTVLPHLYNETKVRKELIREVEMGPFKHTVDDGLDIRKAAFECMYTLLDSCLDRLDIFEFLNHVEDGLKDHYDIKMLTFLMLVRLSTLCPSAVLQRLDRLVEPLRATCTTKVKANSVKQEFEKQDELKRSAMRAVAALLTIPEAEKSPLMSEFQSQISSNPELAAIFESIQKDSSSTNLESMDTS